MRLSENGPGGTIRVLRRLTVVALLLPALASAKEKGKRAACKSNMHQAILAIYMYGGDFADNVPSGLDNEGQWDAIRIDNVSYTNLVNYSGGNSNILDCPNFSYGTQSRYNQDFGYLIGNQYLGNANMSMWKPGAPDFTSSFGFRKSPRSKTCVTRGFSRSAKTSCVVSCG